MSELPTITFHSNFFRFLIIYTTKSFLILKTTSISKQNKRSDSDVLPDAHFGLLLWRHADISYSGVQPDQYARSRC